ncbi:MAG: transglutaminase-like cysteine peptidase [Alphaproteobacteria bacterium]
MRFWLFAITIGVIAYGLAEGADARIAVRKSIPTVTKSTAMITRGAAEAPIGHKMFCKKYHSACKRSKAFESGTVILTKKKFQELQTLNRNVNRSIHPMSDMAQYKVIERWIYPKTGKGDCEDYVLEKQRELIKAGWPQSALLITVVRDEHGEGHAVLTVHTNHGDYILDNKNLEVLPWKDTNYVYIKRQSATNPQHWETLVAASRQPSVAASGIASKK